VKGTGKGGKVGKDLSRSNVTKSDHVKSSQAKPRVDKRPLQVSSSLFKVPDVPRTVTNKSKHSLRKPCVRLARIPINDFILWIDKPEVSETKCAEEQKYIAPEVEEHFQAMEKSVEAEIRSHKEKLDFGDRLKAILDEGCRNHLKLTVEQLRGALRLVYPFIRRKLSEKDPYDFSCFDDEDERHKVEKSFPSNTDDLSIG